jgi:hypothetical protein
MGVGGRGKCPGAPSHHLKRRMMEMIKENELKNGRPKGTVKAVWQKREWQIKKKKNKPHFFAIISLSVGDTYVFLNYYKKCRVGIVFL